MDRLFQVELDKDGSSPNPQVSIWKGQHMCVAEDWEKVSIPSPESCGEIIIKHQLAGDRGHYSVLKMASVKFNCYNFPHSVVAQITRHADSNFLVQSNRYTGERFVDASAGLESVEEVFYLRPVGAYRDRDGSSFFYTQEDRREDLDLIKIVCSRYAKRVNQGCPYEMARSIIPYDFRQNFTISGTLEATWHWLDQRSAKCSQLEIQSLAELIMTELDKWTPELSTWYKKNRYAKARLAP